MAKHYDPDSDTADKSLQELMAETFKECDECGRIIQNARHNCTKLGKPTTEALRQARRDADDGDPDETVIVSKYDTYFRPYKNAYHRQSSNYDEPLPNCPGGRANRQEVEWVETTRAEAKDEKRYPCGICFSENNARVLELCEDRDIDPYPDS